MVFKDHITEKICTFKAVGMEYWPKESILWIPSPSLKLFGGHVRYGHRFHQFYTLELPIKIVHISKIQSIYPKNLIV